MSLRVAQVLLLCSISRSVPDGWFLGKRMGAIVHCALNEGDENRSVLLQLNDQLSFGMHRVWKRMAVRWTGVKNGDRALDICCGSGDLAFILADRVGVKGSVVGLDFAQEMLDDAANRQSKDVTMRWRGDIRWVRGDALELPFSSELFDAATMGYGLRNVADIPTALAELHRVLKPGGKAAVLDFNNSRNPVTDNVQAFFLSNLVVPAARRVGLEAEYEYLRPSIKAFPTGNQQEELALQAGFNKAVHYEIAFGLMGVLVATK